MDPDEENYQPPQKKMKKIPCTPTPPLTLQRETPEATGTFLDRRFHEPIDIGRFTDLLACDESIFRAKDKSYDNARIPLMNILKNYDPLSKSIKVGYKFGSGQIWGRNYPRGPPVQGRCTGNYATSY